MSLNKIKNLKEVSERIKQAVKNKEKIILYGDSDLDGITSVTIMEETIKNLGGQVTTVVFPNREIDGYGVNLKALEFLSKLAPALFITLDLGIGNVEEVEIGNKMGFEFIIVDHHEPAETLPKAKIIIDPKQKGDKSGFQYLCNAGLAFKLAEEILADNFSENIKNSFLELTALATISDMMPQVEDNKTFIEIGLRNLQKTFRPGLKVFLDIFKENNEPLVNSGRIISALNTAESTGFSSEGGSASYGKNESYNLLTNSSVIKCREIAENLLAKLEYKQQKIKEISEEVERRVAKNPNSPIVFEGDPAWKLTLAGPVASIAASRYEKPIFIYKKMDTESTGSVRSLKEGASSIEAMALCKELLITYGGHPKASGFRIKNENLDQFKQCLIEHFKKQ